MVRKREIEMQREREAETDRERERDRQTETEYSSKDIIILTSRPSLSVYLLSRRLQQ